MGWLGRWVGNGQVLVCRPSLQREALGPQYSNLRPAKVLVLRTQLGAHSGTALTPPHKPVSEAESNEVPKQIWMFLGLSLESNC